MRTLALAAFALATWSCTGPVDETSARRPTTTSLPSIVANGAIGIQLSPDATTNGGLNTFFSVNVERTGQERLLPVVGFWNLELRTRGQDAEMPISATQKTDFRTGVVTTECSFTGGITAIVKTVASLLRPEIVEIREVTGPASLTVPIPSGATRTANGFLLKLNSGTATVRLSGHGMVPSKRGFEVPAVEQQPIRIERSVSTSGEPRTFEEVVIENRNRLSGPASPRIEIEGPAEDQRFLDSVIFRLRSALSTPNPNLGPFGLTSDQYNGHVFWDADMWVFPAVALLDPDAASSIPSYRQDRILAAQKNFTQWCADRRPIGDKRELGPYPLPHGGLKFPWESSVSGRETMPGPSNLSAHITPTVAYALNLAAALGLTTDRVADEVLAGADAFIEARSEGQNPDLREIRSTYTADEQLQDNDLYTNLVSQWVLNGGSWSQKERVLKVPGEGDFLLAFDGDTGKSYKQASAVLSIFPLQHPEAESRALAMLNHYEPETFRYGPAMSGSVHATIRARTGNADDAYATWKSDWQRHTVGEDLLFVEKERTPVPYFVTGAAGSLQTVLYGFAGIRVSLGASTKGVPGIKLKRGWTLSVLPALPKAWRSLTIRNLVVLGKRYDLVCREGSAKIMLAR